MFVKKYALIGQVMFASPVNFLLTFLQHVGYIFVSRPVVSLKLTFSVAVFNIAGLKSRMIAFFCRDELVSEQEGHTSNHQPDKATEISWNSVCQLCKRYHQMLDCKSFPLPTVLLFLSVTNFMI